NPGKALGGKAAVPRADRLAPGTAPTGSVFVRTCHRLVAAHARLPGLARNEPVIGGAGVLAAAGTTFLGTLDHASLPLAAPDQDVDRRPRNRRRFEPRLGLLERVALLERLPQQLVGRDVRERPGGQGIQGDVVDAQPRMTGAAPQRRLVQASGKAARSRRGEHPDESRPGDAPEFAGRTGHASDLHMAAEPGERPIQGAGEPWRAVLLAAERRSAPLVRAVEEPDAGELQLGGDRGNLLDVGRA